MTCTFFLYKLTISRMGHAFCLYFIKILNEYLCEWVLRFIFENESS